MRHLWARPGSLSYFLFHATQKNTAQGTATTLVAALDPDATPGAYYVDCRVETRYIHPKASDEALAARLWDFSEEVLSPSAAAARKAAAAARAQAE